MKKIVMIVVSAVAVLGMGAAILAPTAVYAGDDSCAGLPSKQIAACSACVAGGYTWANGKCDEGGQDLNSIIHTVINVMLFIVGILSVIMIIFGGIRYVTSAGNKTQVDNAKNTIIYAVVGLVVAIVAFALVQWVFTSLT